MARCLGSLLVLTTLFFLTNADAQDTPKPILNIDLVFKKLDSNSDGKLVKDEFLRLADRFKDKAKAREKLTTTYKTIDPTNAGLSKEQFRKYLDDVRKKDVTPRKS
jgi:Ca2+-binding EF-hand superfamily protein